MRNIHLPGRSTVHSLNGSGCAPGAAHVGWYRERGIGEGTRNGLTALGHDVAAIGY